MEEAAAAGFCGSPALVYRTVKFTGVFWPASEGALSEQYAEGLSRKSVQMEVFPRVTVYDRNRLRAEAVLCDCLKSILCHRCVQPTISNKSCCTEPALQCLAACVARYGLLWDPGERV